MTKETAEGTRFDVSVMVACYNEEDSIVPTIRTLVACLDKAKVSGEIIVMDDASVDGSADRVNEVISEIGDRPSISIRLHKNAVNSGLQNNVFRCAEMATGRYYWVIAGDNNLTPDVYEALLAKVGQFDIIIPNVLVYRGRSLQRSLLSTAYVRLINLLSGFDIKYYNGSSIYRLEHVAGYAGNIRGFGYSAELIISLIDEGATYTEVEVIYQERQGGKSTALSLSNALDIAGLLLRLVKRRLVRASKLLYATR